jgi:putative endonuclease
MKQQNYNKGKQGEALAKKYLLEKGFNLIEENYSNDIGEIDLVMSDKNFLVFVEVKLKVTDKFGTPEEMITPRKIAQIKRVAQIFLMQNRKLAKSFPQYRIDAVCIILDELKTLKSLNYYENLA